MIPNKKSSKHSKEKNSDTFSGDDKVLKAHDQAETDIESDPDLSLKNQDDDLDEEESVRLRGNKNDLA